jgi:hypothetical protein
MKHIPFFWPCQQTQMSLLGRGKSTRAATTASPQCTCEVENFGVIGPYFFEGEDGRAVTVTSARYVETFRNFLTPELSCRSYSSSKMVQLLLQREYLSENVSEARYFTTRRASMAYTFT